MIAMDASVLVHLFRPDPDDESRLKVESLIKSQHVVRSKVIVPAPAFSEILAGAGEIARQQIIDRLARISTIKLGVFGMRAAIECGELLSAKPKSARRNEGATWAKAKFDWQICAIALAEGAHSIYSEDGDIHSIAARLKISAFRLADVPLPPEAMQTRFKLLVPPALENG